MSGQRIAHTFHVCHTCQHIESADTHHPFDRCKFCGECGWTITTDPYGVAHAMTATPPPPEPPRCDIP